MSAPDFQVYTLRQPCAQAVQITEENLQDVADYLGDYGWSTNELRYSYSMGSYIRPSGELLYGTDKVDNAIVTRHGLIARIGDWILEQPRGYTILTDQAFHAGWVLDD